MEEVKDPDRARAPAGSVTSIDVLADPTGWLLATVIEWDREPSYLGTSLLVDRQH